MYVLTVCLTIDNVVIQGSRTKPVNDGATSRQASLLFCNVTCFDRVTFVSVKQYTIVRTCVLIKMSYITLTSCAV